MSPPDNSTTSTSQHGGHDALIYDEVAGAGAETHADVAPDKPSDELREGLGLEAAKDSRGQDELPQTQVPDDQQPSTATHPSVSQSTASDLQQPQTATASESPAAAAAVEPSPQPVPEVQTDLISLSPEPTAAAKGKQPEHVTAATPGVLLDATKKPSAIAIPRPPNMNLHTYHDDSSSSQQYLSAEPSHYVDPTPPTPQTSQPPSRTPSNAARSHKSDDHSPSRGDRSDDDKRYLSEDEQEGGSRSEIQSIMEQFSESGGGPGAEEVMSPRLEIASPMLSSPVQHPPRKSSLAPLSTSISNQLQDMHLSTSPVSVRSKDRGVDAQAPPVPPKDGTIETPPRHDDSLSTPLSPQLTMHRPPPPEPEPEPALPFDFHRFLEQLRNKKADPVARYLKSFLSEFGKRQWMVHEQVKIISDFLAFIANKMAVCEVWRDVSDAEFDNAREGMEKLVMNRLYSQTFSPAIPAPKPIPGAKPKRKGGDTPMGPGRRGQHQEDVERDDIVTQKINIYGWVKEEHLDIPAVGDSGRRFLKLAQQELLKIKSYRAPRDKIICVLNCCKVIFGLLKHNKSDSSADSFMPLLIYVVLHSNPEHLVSNVQYILRFRNQEKLGGEAGYYLSSLMGAIQFIENLDRTTLTITDDEFEQHVEAAVSAIAEKHQATSPRQPQQQVFNEKTSLVAGEAATARGSMDGHDQTATPRRSTSSNEHDSGDDKAAITGLLRTIQKPLTTIGRIFSDDGGSSSAPQPGGRPAPTSEHAPLRTSTSADEDRDSGRRPSSRHNLSAEEAAARQASAEAAEAERLHRAEHANVVETLAGMFPDLDKDIISDVVYQKEGRVGLAVDACLALST